MKRQRRSRVGKMKLIFGFTVFVAVCALAISAAYWIGRTLETRGEETRGSLKDRFADDARVTYEGVTYRPRRNITSILLIGVDRTSEQSATGYRSGGQADFLTVLVIDDDNKSVTPLQIDRDTMTEITVLGILGNEAGTTTAQICLSHGFGDGGDQSCALTVEAVQKFLLGTSIDYYVALDLDGIPVLNDCVGGITVTLTDDFSVLDSAMTAGTTLTLAGEQAEYYVRGRMNIGIGTNEARAARQRIYLDALSDVVNAEISADSNFAGELLDALDPYLLTDMARGRIINEAWNTRAYERRAVVEPAGTYAVGEDGFMEFRADEAALVPLILSLFYEQTS